VYGITFPSAALYKEWKKNMQMAEERDHRKIGTQQELFFFHDLSPGSAFFLPHGAVLYNTLMDYIKNEYWQRGYTEVMSPNMYNLDLWHISGHASHYRDNMFIFNVENSEFGLKPMNCPGHCLMFAHRARSYRELPLRFADFGVLHRNELSGTLTGLVRVRRFQQDDAHIFCMENQIKEEVLGCLDFMDKLYGILGMEYQLELSTRPFEGSLGSDDLWDKAEAQLAGALNDFIGPGNWDVNEGDGAFYGPKIDIQVFDAMKRSHQCATIQLDFNLPQRFDLKFTGESTAKKDDEEEVVNRPVMIHRAMLGSVERMIAVLCEHFGGKWPFWLSPRQVCVIPTNHAYDEYAKFVEEQLREQRFHVFADVGDKRMNKKIREAQLSQFNYILIVGENEVANKTVNIRDARETASEGKSQEGQEEEGGDHISNEILGEKSLEEAIRFFESLRCEHR
jgi:threonyl-tRNA synthetase